MKETKNFFCIFAAITMLFVPAFAAAQAAQKAGSDTYTWNAELVALDENARTLTVKSRVVGDQPMAELGKFKAGDRIVLTWSGFDKYADAINHAVRYDAAKKYEERFTFPVEFVAFDSAHQYVTFKAPVPANGVSAIKSLKPGEWITATSPHAKSAESPIVSVRPYVSSATNSNN